LSVIDQQRSQFILDKYKPEIETATTAAAEARMRNLFRREIKKHTGYEPKADGKWEDDFKVALEKLKGGTDEERQRYLQEMQALEQTKDKEREDAVNEWQSKYNSLQSEITGAGGKSYLREFLADKKIEGSKDVWASDIYDALNKNYHVAFDGKALSFFDKQNTTVPAKNKAGTQTFKLEEFVDEFLTARGAITTDMRKKNPAEEMKKRVQPGTVLPTGKTIPKRPGSIDDLNARMAQTLGQ
jgi:hypothetical protein